MDVYAEKWEDRLKGVQRKTSLRDATMAEWLEYLCQACPASGAFAGALMREEEAKVERLARMSAETGIPIYESFRCDLNSEIAVFRRTCWRLTGNAQWQLALRIHRSDSGHVVFRALNITAREALAAVKDMPDRELCVATVSPYRPPARSGTLRIANGRVEMEFVFGPHTVISKGHAAPGKLFYCTFGPFSQCMKYSTADERIREILFSTARQVTRLVLGCSIKEASVLEKAAYAEFHWHHDIGFRFIECTFSPVWTGEQMDSQAARGIPTEPI